MLLDKNVCVDERGCTYLDMFIFDDGVSKLCLTKEECMQN